MSPDAADRVHRAAVAVADRLVAARATLALAESCTGGLIAAAISAIPGASAFFWGGAVVYSASAKCTLAGVADDVVARHGTVSGPTTEALARGIRERSGCTYGLAVTGWAGPEAGESGAVGQVHVAVSDIAGTRASSHEFSGDRAAVRALAAIAALDLLHERLSAAQDGADE